MNTEWVRAVCMKLPHSTEEVLWGGDLVFKIGGKMYAVAALEPGKFTCRSSARWRISRSW